MRQPIARQIRVSYTFLCGLLYQAKPKASLIYSLYKIGFLLKESTPTTRTTISIYDFYRVWCTIGSDGLLITQKDAEAFSS